MRGRRLLIRSRLLLARFLRVEENLWEHPQPLGSVLRVQGVGFRV